MAGAFLDCRCSGWRGGEILLLQEMEGETTRNGGLRDAQRARQGENHEGRVQGELSLIHIYYRSEVGKVPASDDGHIAWHRLLHLRDPLQNVLDSGSV